MASVYFDPAVGGNGSTVTDDTDPTTGLDNGGHRTRFVPALQQTVAVAGNAKVNAAAALASANSAAAYAGIIGGQTTSATAWTTGTNYTVGPPASLVNYAGSSYKCIVSHTASASFATDLSANKWQFVANASFTGGTLQSALNEAPPVVLASSATVNIGAAASNNITITGTSQISAFDSIASGAERDITFNGILTLKNNSNIILPGGADIVTAAGDIAQVASNGSGVWQCFSYQRANGQALVPPATLVGDTGSGGTKGLVPAPAAGDAAGFKFLKADGTWGYTEIHLLSVLTANNSAALIDTVSLTATYDYYKIEFEDLTPATATQIVMTLSTDSGVTWLNSGYKNSYSNTYTNYFNISVINTSGGSGYAGNVSPQAVGTAANNGLSGELKFTCPASTTKGKRLYGQVCFYCTDAYSPDFYTAILSGYQSATSAINGIKIAALTGNLASGKVRIYGVRTS